LERGDELIIFLRKLQDSAFLIARKSSYFWQKLPNAECFSQSLRRALQLALLQEKLERLNALANVANRFVGERVDRANCRRHAGALRKQVFGIFPDLELALSTGKDRAIKPGANQYVLKTALEEQLNKQRLKFDLCLQRAELLLCLVGLDRGENFSQAGCVRLRRHFTLELLLLRPFRDRF